MFSVTGLSRKKDYNVYIRAVLNDQYRYKYLYNQWTRVSESDFVHDETRMISKHPNSPQSGGKWMAKDIDFKSLKITHYPKSKGGDVSKNMHLLLLLIIMLTYILCYYVFLLCSLLYYVECVLLYFILPFLPLRYC